MKNKIRIANCGGYWGDDPDAFNRQLNGGPIDYLVMDYLAEITMSILKKQQLKDPTKGYIDEIIPKIIDNIETIKKNDVKIITNAGGINPKGLAEKLNKELVKNDINMKVAFVEGDNIIDQVDDFYDSGIPFKNLETGDEFKFVKDKLVSANVYLGYQPIVEALKGGAQIIICGRVTDTSITMAPMVYEFNWNEDDYEKLASGLVAGHIIECGAQATGGNFTDWEKIKEWNNFGYPIVEAFPDGHFIVTKHENTGGIVTENTVKEQLLYEMGDPEEYISPDVVVNFKTIQLKDLGNDRVEVSGVKGKEPTNFLKVSMAYQDGFKSSGSIMISGGDAINKAEIFNKAFWKRLNIEFLKTNSEFVGFNSCHKDLSEFNFTNEILLRLSVYDTDKEKIKKFSSTISSLILTGPQGVCVTGGRPRIQEVLSYWPTLIPRNLIKTKVTIINENKFEEKIITDENICRDNKVVNKNKVEHSGIYFESNDTEKVTLKKICLARSGDKGDTANIGVIARNNKIYEFIKYFLTEEFIKEKFKSFCFGKVSIYELDNLNSLNFLLEKSLDGGGTKSLMIDSQGKTFAAALLNIKIDCPKELLDSLE